MTLVPFPPAGTRAAPGCERDAMRPAGKSCFAHRNRGRRGTLDQVACRRCGRPYNHQDDKRGRCSADDRLCQRCRPEPATA